MKKNIKLITKNEILKMANKLNIYHKNTMCISCCEDIHNKLSFNKVKILEINLLTNNIKNISEYRKNVIEKLQKEYTDNDNKCTLIKNDDTGINIEIGRLGIRKTFSKRVPIDKLITHHILNDILENAVYWKTFQDKNDKTGIKYHNFLTPVFINNDKKIIFIRSVIKEYSKDKKMNKNFYYHQFEYVDQ